MFDNLSEKLQRVFKNLRGEGKLSAENMEGALREIRLALLEADVNFRVVKQLIENIKVKAMGEEVLTALSPSQQVIKIVHEELIKILGSHESQAALRQRAAQRFPDRGAAGLGQDHLHRQAGALAVARTGTGRMLVSVDVYRPAAREQLKVIAREIGQPIYEGAPEETQPLELARIGAPRERQHRPRRAAGGYRRPAAHRRPADGRAAAAEGAAQPGGDPVRGRRHDRAGRGEIGRRIPQAAGHHGRHPHQDGWRCPRRRGAFHPASSPGSR